MKSKNLYVKSAKVQKCKTCGNYKVIKLKIIVGKFAQFRKNPYLCIKMQDRHKHQENAA